MQTPRMTSIMYVLMKRHLLILLALCPTAFAGSVRFYVGTYTDKSPSQGIYTGLLNTDSGKISSLELAARTPSPNFLATSPDGRSLYAVIAHEGGSVAAFRMQTNGLLEPLNSLPSGKGGCHLAVDATGRNVFVANYTAGSLAGFRAETDGSLEKLTRTMPFAGSGPDLKRQDKSYLHAVYFSRDNRHLYACDLGADAIWQFNLDSTNGALHPMSVAAAKVPPGSGPRHLAFTPDDRFAFVNGEMGLNVTAFARDPVTGVLQLRQTVPVLPADAATNGITSAEIFCHPDGRSLYVSLRDVAGQGRDQIVVFAVNPEGRLERIQNFPAGVKRPRGFGLDPTGRWLLVGGQQDHRLAVMKIDAATGKLSGTDQSFEVGAPVCVLFETQRR
jgi:6-phosphogluconolactonase